MKMIKLSDGASWAEIISALAIVVSLMFLVVEVRENSTATNTANATAHTTMISNWYQGMAKDADAMAAYMKFISDPDSCSVVEQTSAVFSLHAVMLILQNGEWLSYQGVLDKNYQQRLNSVLQTVTSSIGFKRYWSMRKSFFTPKWQANVEALITKNKSNRPSIYSHPDLPVPKTVKGHKQ